MPVPGVFNPCDESTYTPQAFDTVVEKRYNAKINQTRFPWIAVYDYASFGETCDGKYPLRMFYAPYAVYMAQQLGASALIFSRSSFSGKYIYLACLPLTVSPFVVSPLVQASYAVVLSMSGYKFF